MMLETPESQIKGKQYKFKKCVTGDGRTLWFRQEKQKQKAKASTLGGEGEGGERVRVMGARARARACVYKRERERGVHIFGRLKLDITL